MRRAAAGRRRTGRQMSICGRVRGLSAATLRRRSGRLPRNPTRLGQHIAPHRTTSVLVIPDLPHYHEMNGGSGITGQGGHPSGNARADSHVYPFRATFSFSGGRLFSGLPPEEKHDYSRHNKREDGISRRRHTPQRPQEDTEAIRVNGINIQYTPMQRQGHWMIGDPSPPQI